MSFDAQGRPEPQIAAGEYETLVSYLEYQRATLEWKARNLSEAQLAQTIATSTMTLAGLLKHMAFVEDHWFTCFVHDAPRVSPWAEVDWSATPDWEWESAIAEPAEVVHAQWRTSVERSRGALNAALQAANSADPLGTLTKRAWPSGERPSLRWVVVHMIEEYARHNGHADLLREAVDGEVGE